MSQENTYQSFRPGQARIIALVRATNDKVISFRMMGAGGKTRTYAKVYEDQKASGICDHLLIVVATDQQRKQIANDLKAEFSAFGVFHESPTIFDGLTVTKKKVDEGAEIVVTTIQTASSNERSSVMNQLLELVMNTGTWMVVFDECHHLVEKKAWGVAATKLIDMSAFTLACSATPWNRKVTIFGHPLENILYREGVFDLKSDEPQLDKCVKYPLKESYHYQITTIDRDGDEIVYTSDQLMKGGLIEGSIDKWEEKVKLRNYIWDYNEPLLLNPLKRLTERLKDLNDGISEDGDKIPLQLMVRCMSCKHAESVYEWFQKHTRLRVGLCTSKTEVESDAVLDGFCPPKDPVTQRRGKPIYDILVVVWRGTEGFDTQYVVELIDLMVVNFDNGSPNAFLQFVYRGARQTPDIPASEQYFYISVPTDHPFSAIEDIIAFFDAIPPMSDIPKEGKERDVDIKPISEYKGPQRAQLLDIRQDPIFKTFSSRGMQAASNPGGRILDPDDPKDLSILARQYESARAAMLLVRDEAQEVDIKKAEIEVKVGAVARKIIDREYPDVDEFFRKKFIGKCINDINTRILKEGFPKRKLVTNMNEVTSIIQWVNALVAQVNQRDKRSLPEWLTLQLP